MEHPLFFNNEFCSLFGSLSANKYNKTNKQIPKEISKVKL